MALRLTTRILFVLIGFCVVHVAKSEDVPLREDLISVGVEITTSAAFTESTNSPVIVDPRLPVFYFRSVVRKNKSITEKVPAILVGISDGSVVSVARVRNQQSGGFVLDLSSGHSVILGGALSASDVASLMYRLAPFGNIRNLTIVLFRHPKLPQFFNKIDATFGERFVNETGLHWVPVLDICNPACTTGTGPLCNLFTGECHN
jgi:hypothetical protein